MATDPYAAPRARVADVSPPAHDGTFIPEGQAVAAGRGWRWIADGWALFTRQPGIWVLIALAFTLMVILILMIPLLGILALVVLAPAFVAGFMLGCRELERGGELQLTHLFAGIKEKGGTLAVVGLLGLAALFVVIAMIAIGFTGALASLFRATQAGNWQAFWAMMSTILLIVLVLNALLIPIYAAFWFAPALVALNDIGAVEAMRRSFMACLRNFVPFLVYSVVMFGFTLLAGLTYGLGWLVLGPVLATSVYTAYRDIFYVR